MTNPTPLNTEEELDKIFSDLIHLINNNSATSNYIHDEDDEAIKLAKQAIKSLLDTHVREARVDELKRLQQYGHRNSLIIKGRLATLTNDKQEKL